jgi:hypothetical protein
MNITRIAAVGIVSALLVLAAPLYADETPGGDMSMPAEEPAYEEPVTAAPPAFVKLGSTSIAAGIGINWGKGTLTVEGEQHAFSVKGISLLDVGISTMNAEGAVENLENVADFAGRYVAVEAGAALGIGASTIRMKNENGVVIALTSKRKGVQLTLGAEGVSIALD